MRLSVSRCYSGPLVTADLAIAAVAACVTASISEHLASPSSHPIFWMYFRDFVYFCLPPA